MFVVRTMSMAVAMLALVGTLLVAAPAQSAPVANGDGTGKNCVSFRGAERCGIFHIVSDGIPRTPYFRIYVRVHHGGGAEVETVLAQRKSADGWRTEVHASGPGLSDNPQKASYSTTIAPCRDLPRGRYRAKGKVHWTSEGVHYTRWITSDVLSKKRLCSR